MMGNLRIQMVDLFFVVLAGVGLVFWNQASGLKPPFDVYPKMISAVLVILALASLFNEKFYMLRTGGDSGKKERLDTGKVLKMSGLILGIILYIVCIQSVGYFVSTFVYLMTMFQLNKISKPDEFLETRFLIIDGVISLCLTCLIALVFKLALALVFPQAWLF